MFANILSPILGAFFISLACISFTSNINPNLHFSLKNQMKQIYGNIPIQWISFEQFQILCSIILLISGFILHFFKGIKRLLILIPLSIFSVCIVQSTIICSSSLSIIPVYVLILICLLIILFNDCAELDELDMK